MRLRFEHGRRDELKTLHPAYFAMVMATGIVSIAAHLHGVAVLATVLVWLNALFLAALVAATLARILRYPRAFAADIQSHSRGVGFFTTVAGTAVFGIQLLLIQHGFHRIERLLGSSRGHIAAQQFFQLVVFESIEREVHKANK